MAQPTTDRAESPGATSRKPLPRVTGGSYEDDVASARTRDGLSTQVRTRGFDLVADEPAGAGGSEAGPTPYDYLAAALASCTSMTLRIYADREGLPLDEVTTRVQFDRVHADDCVGCEHHDGRIERFRRVVTLRGDLDDQARQRLLAIADRCPVHLTLEGQIEIHTTAGP